MSNIIPLGDTVMQQNTQSTKTAQNSPSAGFTPIYHLLKNALMNL